ncbi:MAG: SBBP repeat-containing protein [Bryobacterales bacterium]
MQFERLHDESSQSKTEPGMARFVARGRGAAISLGSESVMLQLQRPASPSATPRAAAIRMTLPGANLGVEPVGVDQLPGRTHLLVGNDPARWRRNIPQFAKVRYEQVYEGIDLLFYGNPDLLEYDFEIAAGADPGVIRLAFEGARRMHVDEEGDLVLETAAGPLRHRRPRAYQTIAGAQMTVQAGYELESKNTVRFRLGEYDHGRPLVIDPVLVYSTHLGGLRTELGHSIAVDAEGCAYITGQAVSPEFPRTPGFPEPNHLDGETSYAFITKLNPSGTQIIYSSLLGGADYDIGNAIAVDSNGAAYIVGESRSPDFPATTRALQRTLSGERDVFVAKLSPDGSSLLYATYLGGEKFDVGNGIVIDAAGSAYVTGITASSGFPTTSNAYQREYTSGQDVFAAKISADGSRLIYSTLIGGVGDDRANGIAVDRSGNAYLAGITSTRRALGGADAYCLKLNPNGSEVVYLKLFGGLNAEEATSVVLDEAGNAYLTGVTFSKDFPTTARVFQTESKSPLPQFGSIFGYDAFVVKVDPRGENLIFSSLLNGSASSYGRAIALDPEGNITVAGYTASQDFPVTAGALTLLPHDPQFDGFVAKLDPAARRLLYGTRLGGETLDQIWDMALDESGSVYVTGFSVSAEFRVTEGAVQPDPGGALDAFVAKFNVAALPVVAASGVVSGASFLPGAVAPGMIVSIFGSELGPPDGALLELDDNGSVTTQLQGVRVLFNETPAPLIFASQNQVSAIAPYALANQTSLRIVVEYGGARSAPIELTVAESAPGLFTYDSSGAGPAAVLNEDGSINTLANPASRGSIVVLYGTGEGQTEPAGEDGKIAAEIPPLPVRPVSVRIGELDAEVIYAGGAPGLVAGVIQVNARVPAELAETGAVPVILRVGSADSQPGVTLAVR